MSIFHSEDVHLVDYLRVVYKRRIFFAVVVLAALAGTIWSTYWQTPLYSSTARILIDNEGTLVDFPGIERRGLLRLDTEMHIMRSPEVAEHAVRTRLRPGVDRRDPEFDGLVQRVINATGVDIVKSTLIVEERTTADDPEKARAWCEAMAESYVEVNLEAKKAENAAAAAAIREEIGETQRELEAAERSLLAFKVEHNVVSEQAKLVDTASRQGSATREEVDAGFKGLNYEIKYKELLRWRQRGDIEVPLPADISGTGTTNDLYQQILKKRVEYQGLLSRYREQHPKVQGVKAELDTLRRLFDREIDKSLEVLRGSAEVYKSVGAAAREAGEGDKAKILEKSQRDWELTVLQRDVDVKQEIHKELLLKLGEINVTTSIVKNNVRIIERPKAIPVPIRPNWRFNLLVGLVFGVGVAVAGVFFLEYLDKTLKTPDDVARYLGLPVLAVVPLSRADLLRAPYQAPQVRDREPGALGA